MVILSIALVLISLWLLEQNGKISTQKSKRWLSLITVSIACALFIIDYGTMRGIFVFIATLSIVGTFFTLSKGKNIGQGKEQSRK